MGRPLKPCACGCGKLTTRTYRRDHRPNDRKAGDRFWQLTVIGPDPERRGRFLCRCDCGKVKSVLRQCLGPGRGKTKSCGCYKMTCSVTHGDKRNRQTSGEYRSWSSMVTRCTNPKNPHFHNYGGRGVTVCARWAESYEAFLHDMGRRPSPKHTLERKDNMGNYEPGNVVWATSAEQNRNRRNNRVIEFNGRRQVLMAWAEEMGIDRNTLAARLNRGWNLAKALLTPPDKMAGRFKRRETHGKNVRVDS